MQEENNNIQTSAQTKVKSFKFKWYEFFIIYGIINVSAFFRINSIINNIYKSYSELYTSGVMIDGTDFSVFTNMFATPIFLFLAISNIIIGLLVEFVIKYHVVILRKIVRWPDNAQTYLYRHSILNYNSDVLRVWRFTKARTAEKQ